MRGRTDLAFGGWDKFSVDEGLFGYSESIVTWETFRRDHFDVF